MMIVNSGYSEGGASLRKKRLKLWTPIKLSPQSDINLNLSLLRGRSADLAINTAIGAAIINTITLYTIGDGLRIVPRLNSKELGLSREAVKEYERRIKAEFEHFSEDTDVDYYRRNNLKDLQQIAFETSLIDGDSFVLFKRVKPSNKSNPYTLKLQIIEGNRVNNPNSGVNTTGMTLINSNNGNRIIDGVEIDKTGRLVAYWISSGVPGDVTNSEVIKWDRVNVYGDRTGFKNILQISRDSRAGMTRGIPILSPVIETIKQISRYVEAELDSAITRSYYSLFFTQFNNTQQMDLNDLQEGNIDTSGFRLGSGTIAALPAGVDVKSIDSSKQSTFPAFIIELTKQVGAAIGIPYEVLMHSFNSSYSASRAALLQAWNNFRKLRACFIRDFCEPIYQAFLMESVANGRLILPGYGIDPIKTRLWSQCECYGVTMSILDPKKEIEASKMKIELGLTTHEKESTELTSTDYSENVEQLIYERGLVNE